jgi:multidrug resistance protein, MATE family
MAAHESSSHSSPKNSPFKPILTHAGSVLIGQLAGVGFATVDTVLLARYSSDDLAALSVSIAIAMSVIVTFFGVMSALMPAIGRLYGAQQYTEIGKEVQQGFYLALMCGSLGMAVLMTGGWIGELAKVPVHLQPKVTLYLRYIGASLVFSMLFRVYAGLNIGISRPWLMTALQVGLLPLKIALSVWFIYGGLGVAAMGSVGAGCATMVTMMVTACLALAMMAWHPAYKPFGIYTKWYKPDSARLRSLAEIGIPSGLSYFIEVTSFSLMAIFISRFGSHWAASHQIAVNTVSILFMVPLSLAMASSALVAQELGAQRPREAKRAAYTGLRLTMGLSLVFTLLTWLLRERIARWYSPDPQVYQLASGLLLVGAAMHFGDALQCVTSYLLRSYHVATVPTVIYAMTLWGLGFGGGYALGFNVTGNVPAQLQGAYGFWVCNAISLLLVGLIFLWMVRQKSRAEQAQLRPPPTLEKASIGLHAEGA